MTLFELRERELSVAEVLAAVIRPEAGGTSLFVGTVRSDNAGRAVTLLEYQAYACDGGQEMARIGAEIKAEIAGVELGVLHRVGSLKVGEIAVVCAASAPHRGEAFEACRRLNRSNQSQSADLEARARPERSVLGGLGDARCAAHGHSHGSDQ